MKPYFLTLAIAALAVTLPVQAQQTPVFINGTLKIKTSITTTNNFMLLNGSGTYYYAIDKTETSKQVASDINLQYRITVLPNGKLVGLGDSKGVKGLYAIDTVSKTVVLLQKFTVNDPINISNPIVGDGNMYFNITNDNNSNKVDFWKTDGTAANTLKLFSLANGKSNTEDGFFNAAKTAQDYNGTFSNMVYLKGHLYFLGLKKQTGEGHLVKADASKASTPQFLIYQLFNEHPFVFNNNLYFNTSGNGSIHKPGLWKYDGLSSFSNLDTTISMDKRPVVLNSTVAYFNTYKIMYRLTANGIEQVHALNPFDINSYELLDFLGETNNNLIVRYSLSGGSKPDSLVAINLTTKARTVLGPGGSNNHFPFEGGLISIAVNGKVYFNGKKNGTSTNLFETDGTVAGTKAITFTNNGAVANPRGFFTFNNKLYCFITINGTSGSPEPALIRIGSAGTTSIAYRVTDQASCITYPNPTRGKFTLALGSEKAEVEILDMKGAKVYSQVGNAEIDLSNQAKGLYIIRVYDHEEMSIGKLLLE